MILFILNKNILEIMCRGTVASLIVIIESETEHHFLKCPNNYYVMLKLDSEINHHNYEHSRMTLLNNS